MDMHKNDVELFDEDLREIMGDRYDDGEVPTEMPVMEVKSEAKPKHEPKKIEHMDAQCCPFPEKQKTTMDRLQTCVTWLGICGGISMLMWWFWMNGLMAMEAAYPCILASAVIGGIGVGRSSK